MRSGGNFEESVRNFTKTVVHPDDQEEVLSLLGKYLQEVFDEGMASRDRRYRILDRKTESYVWCQATVVRTNLENPLQRRVLLIWRKEKAPIDDFIENTTGRNR